MHVCNCESAKPRWLSPQIYNRTCVCEARRGEPALALSTEQAGALLWCFEQEPPAGVSQIPRHNTSSLPKFKARDWPHCRTTTLHHTKRRARRRREHAGLPIATTWWPPRHPTRERALLSKSAWATGFCNTRTAERLPSLGAALPQASMRLPRLQRAQALQLHCRAVPRRTRLLRMPCLRTLANRDSELLHDMARCTAQLLSGMKGRPCCAHHLSFLFFVSSVCLDVVSENAKASSRGEVLHM